MNKWEIIYRKTILWIILLGVIFSFLFFMLLPTDLIKEAISDAQFAFMNKNIYYTTNQNIRIRWDSANTDIHFLMNPMENVDIVSYSILGSMLSNNQYNVNIVNSTTLFENTYAGSFDMIIEDFDEDARYYMVVHGEDHATSYVNEHTNLFQGIIYLDSQPSVMANDQLNVLCVYTDAYDMNKQMFPQDTTYVKIDGGISENYINLKYQLGKNEAKINRLSQQKLAVDEIISWVESYEIE